MHACHGVDAMPFGFIGEVGTCKGDVTLKHPCKALLLIVGRRSQVNCPSYVSRSIPVLRSTVHQVKLIPCDSSCSFFGWSVVDNCPIWPNRADGWEGKADKMLLLCSEFLQSVSTSHFSHLFVIYGPFKPAEVLAQCSRVSIVG